jgi:hypothetical protein
MVFFYLFLLIPLIVGVSLTTDALSSVLLILSGLIFTLRTMLFLRRVSPHIPPASEPRITEEFFTAFKPLFLTLLTDYVGLLILSLIAGLMRSSPAFILSGVYLTYTAVALIVYLTTKKSLTSKQN